MKYFFLFECAFDITGFREEQGYLNATKVYSIKLILKQENVPIKMQISHKSLQKTHSVRGAIMVIRRFGLI